MTNICTGKHFTSFFEKKVRKSVDCTTNWYLHHINIIHMGILEGRGDESPRTVAPTDGWVEDTGRDSEELPMEDRRKSGELPMEDRRKTEGRPKDDERMREG